MVATIWENLKKPKDKTKWTGTTNTYDVSHVFQSTAILTSFQLFSSLIFNILRFLKGWN